jgi:hypothetical protein
MKRVARQSQERKMQHVKRKLKIISKKLTWHDVVIGTFNNVKSCKMTTSPTALGNNLKHMRAHKITM